MNDEELREQAKSCSGCTDWLHICKAICCKVIVFHKKGGWEGVKTGDTIRLERKDLPVTMRRYFQLHGVTLNRGIISFKLDEYNVEGDRLFMFKRCEYLTDDNKCKRHPSKKPLICQEYDESNYGEDRFYNPPECLFRWKGGKI